MVIEEWNIREIQELMDAEALTAKALVKIYLARIEKLDKNGPALNAVIEINPEAEKIADKLDAERKANGPRGLLHGIPILIKDNIDTADRMATTAGSLALIGSIPPEDAFLVQKLRKAGAVILGKTNLSEWANFRSSQSSSGWSSRGGQTRSPYALDRNPCGSSSGSAVAVSANLCSVAIGTETDGSIICPSQANGIVGIKPTIGLISRFGIIPIAHSQDTAGPMARTVEDASILLGALVGEDSKDPVTAESQGRSHKDYTQFLDLNGLKDARIGVARNFFGFDKRVDQIMEVCIQSMKDQGAVIVDPVNLEKIEELHASEFEVLLYEFKADINQYLSRLGPDSPVGSLDEIIVFNEKNRDRVMPFFDQERMLLAKEKGPLTDEAYLKALEANHRLSKTEGIDAMLKEYQLDAIIAPSGGPAWVTDWINGDHSSGGSSTPAAVAGYPNITVPAGTVFGLPVGISFFSGAYQEPKLIRLAYAFEQTTKARRAPQFLLMIGF